MSYTFETEGSVGCSEPKDEVAVARRAALVSWITVVISLLALFLVNGTIP